jgi:MFS family permease
MVVALAAMSLAAVPLILLGAGATTFWLATAAFGAGVATEIFTVVWVTVNSTHIPEHLLSRVGAHDEFWSTAPIPIGQLATPILAAAFGSGIVAITGGGMAALVMLVPILVPSLRKIEVNRPER